MYDCSGQLLIGDYRNCGASSGQWCTWASTLEGESPWLYSINIGQANFVVGTQLGGKEVPASAGDKVTMHCKHPIIMSTAPLEDGD